MALSSDGDEALIGGPGDKAGFTLSTGAAWAFTRSDGVWTQQGSKFTYAGATSMYQAHFGVAVALSSDGDTGLVGGPGQIAAGNAWVFTKGSPGSAVDADQRTGGRAELHPGSGRGDRLLVFGGDRWTGDRVVHRFQRRIGRQWRARHLNRRGAFLHRHSDQPRRADRHGDHLLHRQRAGLRSRTFDHHPTDDHTVTAPATTTFTAAASTPANCARRPSNGSPSRPAQPTTHRSPAPPQPPTPRRPPPLPTTAPDDQATFTNTFGSTTTNPATLTVNAPPCAAAPSITTQPTDHTVTAPATSTFTAAASTPANCAAPTVQWLSKPPGAADYTPIPGATTPSYTTPATTTAQNGTRYQATFTNTFESTTTNPATLTVNAPPCAAAPSITTQPTDHTVTAPADHDLHRRRLHTRPTARAPTVQWLSKPPGAAAYTPIPGATTATYTTPATTTAHNGTRYQATFTNAFGSTTTNPATLTVNAARLKPRIDATATATRRRTATVRLTTPTAGDLLVAFVAGDGPRRGGQRATVSGGSLSWTLVGRTNGALGTAEIWSARAAGTLTRSAIHASLAKTRYKASLTVVAFSDASGIGAGEGAHAKTGPPTASLTTTADDSWVFGVGNDWDRSRRRRLGPNQTMVSQSINRGNDTHWVQRTRESTASAGTRVTINDTAPTLDRWNLRIVEVR